MNYIVMLVVFSLMFLRDRKHLQKDNNKREKIVYGTLFSLGVVYSFLLVANIARFSLIDLLISVVAYLRGINIPTLF
ncbi:MAG TPA: hypothetical protein GX522_05340 [Firmicutes bacterium]|nr:hypothetical protein [Bacillota bacterium]